MKKAANPATEKAAKAKSISLFAALAVDELLALLAPQVRLTLHSTKGALA